MQLGAVTAFSICLSQSISLLPLSAPRSNSSGLEKSVKVCLADVSWGSWMLSVVLRDEVWCLDIRGRLPRVVFSAEALPLNQELEPSLVPATI